MAHPWRDDDLKVEGEPEELDEYFQKLVDNDEFCSCCGCLDATGDCPCGDWDDDCFIGKGRPWDSTRWNYAVRLSKKGKLLRAEIRAEMSDLINGLERRAKIRKARRRWMVVKDAVDERRVVLYWQEQTQRKLCAPDGAGRAADAALFASEFQGESA